MSAVERLARPRRINAAHRRRWKCSTGSRLYANDNPYRYTDPDGRETGSTLQAEWRMMGAKPQTYQAPGDRLAPALKVAFSLLPVIGPGFAILNAAANPTKDNVGAALASVLPGGRVAEGASAMDRAAALAGTMGKVTQTKVTIAVTETAEGARVVSSSEGALRPATRAALGEGEVAGKGVSGTHAEVNGVNAAQNMGLTPTGTAASRPICSSCAQHMEQQGVKPLSPLKHEP